MFFVLSAFFYIQGNIFCLSSKTPRRGCNHCILRVHRNVLRKNKKLDFPKKVKFLCHSRRLQENLRRGDQHCIHRDKGIFMQIIFFKIYVFLTFFHLERNIFRHLLKTLRRRCSYCILRVHRNVMRKNKSLNFRKKVWIYYLSRRLRGNFRRGGQHCIHRDNRNFILISFFYVFRSFLLFFTFRETFSAFRRKHLGDVVITTFFVSIGTFWGKTKKGFFEKSLSFLSFLETAKKISAGWSTLHLPRQ